VYKCTFLELDSKVKGFFQPLNCWFGEPGILYIFFPSEFRCPPRNAREVLPGQGSRMLQSYILRHSECLRGQGPNPPRPLWRLGSGSWQKLTAVIVPNMVLTGIRSRVLKPGQIRPRTAELELEWPE
jgi:hypothetical protein